MSKDAFTSVLPFYYLGVNHTHTDADTDQENETEKKGERWTEVGRDQFLKETETAVTFKQ